MVRYSFRVTLVLRFLLLISNFWNLEETYECHLSFCDCKLEWLLYSEVVKTHWHFLWLSKVFELLDSVVVGHKNIIFCALSHTLALLCPIKLLKSLKCGGYTLTLHVIIQVVSTFCTQKWWTWKHCSCTLLYPLMLLPLTPSHTHHWDVVRMP